MEFKNSVPMLINSRFGQIKRDKESTEASIKALGNLISSKSAYSTHGTYGYSVIDSIAVVSCAGPMMKGMARYGYADQSELTAIMNSLKVDNSVKGILTVFDTPGGSVAGTADYSDAIAEVGKPHVGYAQDLICSAGYWAGAQCDKLFCNRSAIVGSIGVISWITDATEYMEKIGIKDIALTTGEFKAAGDPSQEATPEIIAYMKGIIDDLYTHFVDAVNKGRSISKANIKGLEAAVFVGEKAQEKGLVDGICSLTDAFEVVSKMANRTPQKSSKKASLELEIEMEMNRA